MTEYICVFRAILEINSNFSLGGTKSLVFVTETQCEGFSLLRYNTVSL